MYIKFENVSKKAGDKLLFSKVDLILGDKYKIGLVGKNGTGKSTFLKLIYGDLTPEFGAIKIDPKPSSRAYFTQFLEDKINQHIHTTLDYLMEQNIVLSKLYYTLKTSSDPEEITTAIGEYSEHGGYEYESKAVDLLQKYGLEPSMNINSLSGGQKTRLQLSKIELAQAQILLLDEPTNHLDSEGNDLFESFVKEYKGLVIIASHDRKLLSNSVQIILDFDNQRITEYSGNYDFYYDAKSRARLQAEERNRHNEKRVDELNQSAKKLADRINRHESNKQKLEIAVARTARLDKKNKAQKTKIIKQKLKLYRDNDKMAANFLLQRQQQKLAGNRSNILDRAQKVGDNITHHKIGWGIKLDFNTQKVQSDFIAQISELTFGYDKLIFNNFNLQISPNDKIALIGPNGIGKSTLLKLLASQILPQKGDITFASDIKIGYLEQENLGLDITKSALAEFKADNEKLQDGEARSFMHFFLFEGEMPLRKVGNLSEGEKLKLKLAKLLYSAANFLLLDEPTNHLDIPSQEAVEKALRDYDGGLIIASHDQKLLDRIGITKTIDLSTYTSLHI